MEGQPSGTGGEGGPSGLDPSFVAKQHLMRGQGRPGPKAAAAAAAKYGVNPKQKLIQKDVKYFDSADWALQKDGGPVPENPMLQPKLQPDQHERKASKSGLSSHSEAQPME